MVVEEAEKEQDMIIDEKKEDDTIYCDWCGEFPYYISICNKDDTSEEELLCKKCYESMEEEETIIT